jgi:hypothetical protein
MQNPLKERGLQRVGVKIPVTAIGTRKATRRKVELIQQILMVLHIRHGQEIWILPALIVLMLLTFT